MMLKEPDACRAVTPLRTRATRVLIGAEFDAAIDALCELYSSLGNQEVPGTLSLADGALRFEPDPALFHLTWFPRLVLHDADDLAELLRWRLPLDRLNRVSVEGWLPCRLVVQGPDDLARPERFGVAGARGWRRAVEHAAGLAPQEALSRSQITWPDSARLSRPAG